MTKREANLILRRMHRQLRNGEVRTVLDRKIKDCCGSIDWPDGTMEIRLNPDAQSKGGIVSTFLHELLHAVFYDSKEGWIRRTEKELYKVLSDRQLTNLIRKGLWSIGR